MGPNRNSLNLSYRWTEILNDIIWGREIFLYVKFSLHSYEEQCLGSLEHTKKKPDRVIAAACYQAITIITWESLGKAD